MLLIFTVSIVMLVIGLVGYVVQQLTAFVKKCVSNASKAPLKRGATPTVIHTMTPKEHVTQPRVTPCFEGGNWDEYETPAFLRKQAV